MVSRALVLASVISGGTTLGVTAAFKTVKDLDSTIFPSAAGYSSQVSKLSAMTRHMSAWPNDAAHMASRRPRWNRSSIGPITGATNANGATVISRYSATFVFDESVLAAEKNSVFASATAIAASLA